MRKQSWIFPSSNRLSHSAKNFHVRFVIQFSSIWSFFRTMLVFVTFAVAFRILEISFDKLKQLYSCFGIKVPFTLHKNNFVRNSAFVFAVRLLVLWLDLSLQTFYNLLFEHEQLQTSLFHSYQLIMILEPKGHRKRATGWPKNSGFETRSIFHQTLGKLHKSKKPSTKFFGKSINTRHVTDSPQILAN